MRRMEWRPVIRAALERSGGIVTRSELLAVVPREVVDAALRLRWLVRHLPHTYLAPETAPTDDVRARAALRHLGPGAALSHTTALNWHLRRPLPLPLRATIDHGRRLHGAPALVVHRRLDFATTAPQCQEVRGVLVTEPARSLVDAWPLLPRPDRRPAAIEVVRTGLTTPTLLGTAFAQRPNVAGRRELSTTIALLRDGVRSELEALGVLTVFDHPDLPRSTGQKRVDVAGRHFYLDRCWEEAMLAVELDGKDHHTSPVDRARDLERDRLLATRGWLVLRFTYADVVRDPAGVRRTVLAVHRQRMTRSQSA